MEIQSNTNINPDLLCTPDNCIFFESEDIQKKELSPKKFTWTGLLEETADAALPLLFKYNPITFPFSFFYGCKRLKTSLTELIPAFEKRDYKEISKQMLRTGVAVVGLAGTLFALPVGMLIKTAYDMIAEAKKLSAYTEQGEYALALESGLSILSNALFYAMLIQGRVELSVAYFAVRIVIGLLQTRQDFANGHYIKGLGHTLMVALNIKELAVQINLLLPKEKTPQLIENGSGQKPLFLARV